MNDTTPGTKTKTTLNLSHIEIKRLLDAMYAVHEPLDTSKPGVIRWQGEDQREHNKLMARLHRADRRFALYES
tara:strand:- start:1087 stop:1305 length:219 start_codon:yes stop_codon:yes gene_type:complete